MTGATITLRNAHVGDALGVSGTLPGGIQCGVTANGTHVLLTGSASRADYDSRDRSHHVLELQYERTQRNVSVTLLDGNGGAGSPRLININSAPAITSVENGDVTEDAGAGATGPNLVFNGGFNSFTLAPDSPAPGLIATLPGWTRQGTVLQADFDDFVSSVASLQINGLTSISQNITTVAGQRYQLSFWADGPTSEMTQAWFNGGFLIDAKSLVATDPFRLYTVEFEGTGGPAELRFTQPGFGSSNLDDVSVRLISPPRSRATAAPSRSATPTPATRIARASWRTGRGLYRHVLARRGRSERQQRRLEFRRRQFRVAVPACQPDGHADLCRHHHATATAAARRRTSRCNCTASTTRSSITTNNGDRACGQRRRRSARR